MVVAGLSSFNERIAQSVAFMEWGFNAWKSVPLAKKGARLQTAEVQLGAKREDALIAPPDLAVPLPRASRTSAITESVPYTAPITRPLARGTIVPDLVTPHPNTDKRPGREQGSSTRP